MHSRAQGYLFAFAAVAIFAIQDAISKYLAIHYPIMLVVMFRFWAFALFGIFIATRTRGLRVALRTGAPKLQLLRGLLLIFQVIVMVRAFTLVGIAMTQLVLQCAPLIITVLAVPLLGEKLGWRRILAVCVGLAGVLIILQPGHADFDPLMILPVIGTLSFSLYSIVTRAVAKHDHSSTSVLYTACIGAVIATCIGPFFWVPIEPRHIGWVIALCLSGSLSHWFLIVAYEKIEAGAIQPLTYFQFVIGAIIAVTIFDETLTMTMLYGATLVISSGLFTMWREFRRKT